MDFAASQFPYNGPGYSFVVGPADYNDQIKLTITQTVGGCSGMTLGPYASSAHAILNATTDNISLAYVESSGISGTVSIHPTAWATGTVTTPVDTATTGYSVANYNHCFSAAGYSCPSSVSFYPNTTGRSVTQTPVVLGLTSNSPGQGPSVLAPTSRLNSRSSSAQRRAGGRVGCHRHLLCVLWLPEVSDAFVTS